MHYINAGVYKMNWFSTTYALNSIAVYLRVWVMENGTYVKKKQ